MVEDLVYEHFPNADIQTHLDDGINESCVFTSPQDDTKYVCKSFSSGLASGPSNYLASLKLVDEHITDTEQFSTPEIYDYGLSVDTVYVFYEYIEGNVLSFDNLVDTEGVHEQYIRQIARALAELHQVKNPVGEFGWYVLGDSGNVDLSTGYKSSSGMVLSYLEHNFMDIRREDDVKFVEDRRHEIFSCIDNKLEYSGPAVIAHGDVKYSNLIDSNGELYVIDWEFPRSVDPMYEFVKTDRKLFRRYDYRDRLDIDRIEYLQGVFREEYFGASPIEYDELRYQCYWVQEMLECLGACTNWYPEEEVSQVTSYYKNEITKSLDRIEQL